jgi:hypothetical protein
MRFRPPPTRRGYQLGVRRVRREQARRTPLSSASAALRFPQSPARGKSLTRARKDSDRGQRAYAPPRRGVQSEGVAGLQGSARTRRSSGRRVLRASTEQRRAFSQASPDRARRARCRPPLLCTSLAPQPLSNRKPAQHSAVVPSLLRNRLAAPSQCREARAQAHRRATRLASTLRGDCPPKARERQP